MAPRDAIIGTPDSGCLYGQNQTLAMMPLGSPSLPCSMISDFGSSVVRVTPAAFSASELPTTE